MAAAENAIPAQRFGLSEFNAIDTAGQPTLDDEEDMASSYPDVGLRLGDTATSTSGTLHITST